MDGAWIESEKISQCSFVKIFLLHAFMRLINLLIVFVETYRKERKSYEFRKKYNHFLYRGKVIFFLTRAFCDIPTYATHVPTVTKNSQNKILCAVLFIFIIMIIIVVLWVYLATSYPCALSYWARTFQEAYSLSIYIYNFLISVSFLCFLPSKERPLELDKKLERAL